MTISSVFRQGTLHTLFHDEFWKSDHDFQFMIQSNILANTHCFRVNEVVLQIGYDVIVSPQPGMLYEIFMTDCESEHDFLIVNLSDILSAMHGFRENEVFCKPNMKSSWFLRQWSLHAMTSLWFSRQEALQAVFHDGFWKSEHDLLIAYLGNFLSGVHSFRDNEVLLPSGYDSFLRQVELQAIFMTDFERATITSWQWSIITFYLWRKVYEITRFYCKPNITSSWFLR